VVALLVFLPPLPGYRLFAALWQPLTKAGALPGLLLVLVLLVQALVIVAVVRGRPRAPSSMTPGARWGALAPLLIALGVFCWGVLGDVLTPALTQIAGCLGGGHP
jgi:hypothetical protein